MEYITDLFSLFGQFWNVFLVFDFYSLMLVSFLGFGVVLTIFIFIMKGKY